MISCPLTSFASQGEIRRFVHSPLIKTASSSQTKHHWHRGRKILGIERRTSRRRVKTLHDSADSLISAMLKICCVGNLANALTWGGPCIHRNSTRILITFTHVGARMTYFGITIYDVMRSPCIGFSNNQRLVAQDVITTHTYIKDRCVRI